MDGKKVLTHAFGRGGCRGDIAAAVCGLAALLSAPAASAQTEVELELVLAVDASSSVRYDEFMLQMRGIAEAFRHPEVVAALEMLDGGGIAVSLLQWSSPSQQDLSVGWAYVFDEASAMEFADVVDTTGRVIAGGATAIGEALQASLHALEANDFQGRRQTIDVSGDGRSNMGVRPAVVRDEAVARGITINGLAVLSDEPGVDRHYREEVIGGPGAFVVTARDYNDFAEAMLEKLVREIAATPVAERAPDLRGLQVAEVSGQDERPAPSPSAPLRRFAPPTP